MTRYTCANEQRRQRVRAHPALNGIDFLEVDESRRERLFVTLLKPTSPTPSPDQVRIDGGDTVRGFRVLGVTATGQLLTVELDKQGDFSAYTLSLTRDATSEDPIAGFDPLLSEIPFSFKAGCPTSFDCRPATDCPPEPRSDPDIDYQARDFVSFRRLMLDRMARLAPEWSETSVADVMHALVDLKAYVADYQAYQQDAVATEAYLHTARRRISVARHARLLDYTVYEGASARAWIQVVVDPASGSGGVDVPAGTMLLTKLPDMADRVTRTEAEMALKAGPEVFETVEGLTAFAAHNRMLFYTWGDEECCLPRGATAATLLGDLAHLRPGDVLVLEEVRGPKSGAAPDADLLGVKQSAWCRSSAPRIRSPRPRPS